MRSGEGARECHGGGAAGHSNTLTLPWGAWNPDGETRDFHFPSTWSIELLQPQGWPPATAPATDKLGDAVRQAAAGRDRACIVVDDLTRPAPVGPLLDLVVESLKLLGIADSGIDVVIATGAHGRPSVHEIRLKVGRDIAECYGVRVHDIAGELAETGLELGGVPLLVDAGFVQADFRIGISSLIPNPFAGFSGGGKIVLPGLASIEALEWLHKLGMMGLGGGVGRTMGNRIRQEIDRVAEALSLDFWIGCLVDSTRRVREICWGSPAEAFATGCERARSVYATPMSGKYDVLFCNAFPKDAEFIQAENAYSPLRTGGLSHIDTGASVVLMASCHKGRGQHGLFDVGMPLFRRPLGPKRYLGDVAVHVYAPGIGESDFRVTHWKGYSFFTSWEMLIGSLEERHGRRARAGVFPAASCQLGPQPQP